MSILYIGIAVAVVTGGYTMYSQYQMGKAQEKMYQAQADQAREEGKAAQDRAQAQSELAQDQGKEDSVKLRRQQMKFLASQKANLAAMGISGVSTEDIISDTTMIQEQDKSTLKWNADMASWEAITTGTYQAWASNNQAAVADASKYNTRKATNMKMTSTFLKTASSVVGSFSAGGGASQANSAGTGGSVNTGMTAGGSSFGSGTRGVFAGASRSRVY